MLTQNTTSRITNHNMQVALPRLLRYIYIYIYIYIYTHTHTPYSIINCTVYTARFKQIYGVYK
jgi:hypothetical protein